MINRLILSAGLFVLLTASLPALAEQGRGRGRARQASVQDQVDVQRNDRVFGREEIRVIREWFTVAKSVQGLPPGLAKREQLPPGLQRQLKRNGTLPPGLQKQIQPLPGKLADRLPELPVGMRCIVLAGNVILLEEKTARIIDLIADVF